LLIGISHPIWPLYRPAENFPLIALTLSHPPPIWPSVSTHAL